MTSNIYWIFKAEIGEGKLEALKKLASKFCQITEIESSVIAYEWSISTNGKMLHVYERYVDSDAALTHLANVDPHIPELMELVTPTEIICYGAASNSFKEAVKDFPMVYMENFEGFHKAIAV